MTVAAICLNILLMIVLCWPELPCHLYLSDDGVRFKSLFFPHVWNDLFGHSELLITHSVNAWPVLCASIRALLVECSRVVHIHKKFDQCLVFNLIFVENDFHTFCVACCSAAYLFISWVLSFALLVATSGGVHSFEMHKAILHAPKAPSSKVPYLLTFKI